MTSAYDKKNSTSVIRVGDGLKKRSSARSAVQTSRFTRGHNPTSTGTKDTKSKNGTQSQSGSNSKEDAHKHDMKKLCIHCRDEDEAGDDEYSLFNRERVVQNLKEIDPSTLSWPSMDIASSVTTLCVSWYKKSYKVERNLPFKCIMCDAVVRECLLKIQDEYGEKGCVV